ncbi:MAG: DEAD/DEAH box helicase [Verrucomicrobia bacterium]|nr:DEAD/DEAH box helicase [Verrucomicrobiota bacterium]
MRVASLSESLAGVVTRRKLGAARGEVDAGLEARTPRPAARPAPDCGAFRRALAYLHAVRSSPQPQDAPALQHVVVPDLWQQQAVAALRAGQDVVVHAPTGAGKTLIFELWSDHGKNRGQAIYTVPTRALANDKLAEWRSKGWNVGIATGDLSENLDAPVIVATLETQKNRLIAGDGPALLVVDEYQMLGNEDRGLNYELAIALAPPRTQLLLLSGSVGNPRDVVKWLKRIGRDAVLVQHDVRPVPLEEVWASKLNYRIPSEIRGYWPGLVAKALAEDLGPILIFSPRRASAADLAAELARQLPASNPLTLSAAQQRLAGEHLARLLRCRIAYHHSGLSYGARAGVVEPLAKAGQLRVVVATMGLAAGINFSLRSVALAAATYRRDAVEQPLRPDEILQMFGRAGRRGLDETGYILISANEVRALDAHACQLARSGLVDWGALLSVMGAAAANGRDAFAEAVRVQERLFTTRPVFLGVESAMKHPGAPCGLKTDSERARRVRQKAREMRNSRGEWERAPQLQERMLPEIVVADRGAEVSRPAGHPRSVLSEPEALEKAGPGELCAIATEHGVTTYGRAISVADKLHDGRVVIAKWIRRLTNWGGRQAEMDVWREKIRPLVEKKFAQQKMPVVRFAEHGHRIVAEVSIASLTMKVPVDRHGVALWRPLERETMQPECAQCPHTKLCLSLAPATGVALLWRRLGLVDAGGVPTRRGQLISFFHGSDGLALSAALEDERYPLDELIYDLANLDAGFRFCGEDNRWEGRLVVVCRQVFGMQSIPGYLENGAPPRYGAGAEAVVASVHKNPLNKHGWVSDQLGAGDVDRVIIEWRSTLRQIAHAPAMDWPRWKALQAMARELLRETESPTLTDLPPLEFHQTKRADHRLQFRRH